MDFTLIHRLALIALSARSKVIATWPMVPQEQYPGSIWCRIGRSKEVYALSL